jgi:F-type H+-transporting ATPase subunit delta
MRGASRAVLAEAKSRLAALPAETDFGRLGGEMFAFATLLDREPALRRALSDPARDGSAKAELATSLLRGQLGEPSLDLVASLVAGRWSEPGDLPDAAEQLGVLAITEIADQAGELDDLEDELFRFGRVVNGQPELRSALSSPFLPAERKQDLLGALLGGKVTGSALRLITQAAVQPRGRSLDTNLEAYARLAAERRERLVAEVHVAVPLTGQQRGRLAAALAAAYGHDVHLNIALDPQVIGGMSVRIAGEIIDGSMATRLAGLRRRLAA